MLDGRCVQLSVATLGKVKSAPRLTSLGLRDALLDICLQSRISRQRLG